MARIVIAPEVAEDFDRIVEHLLEHEAEKPVERVDAIIAAIDLLEASPLIGRRCHRELRELVIGRGSRGFVALYQYAEEIDTVFVLAVRSQREAGYVRQTDDPEVL